MPPFASVVEIRALFPFPMITTELLEIVTAAAVFMSTSSKAKITFASLISTPFDVEDPDTTKNRGSGCMVRLQVRFVPDTTTDPSSRSQIIMEMK
jgi:hypothetical protein